MQYVLAERIRHLLLLLLFQHRADHVRGAVAFVGLHRHSEETHQRFESQCPLESALSAAHDQLAADEALDEDDRHQRRLAVRADFGDA